MNPTTQAILNWLEVNWWVVIILVMTGRSLRWLVQIERESSEYTSRMMENWLTKSRHECRAIQDRWDRLSTMGREQLAEIREGEARTEVGRP